MPKEDSQPDHSSTDGIRNEFESDEETILWEDQFQTLDPLESYDPDMTRVLEVTPGSVPVPVSSDSASKSDRTPDLTETLQNMDQQRIRQLCEQYKQAWTSESHDPRIEDFVPPDLSFDTRLTLVRELISLDLMYRREKSKSLPLEAYLSKFPQFRDSIENVFSRETRIVQPPSRGSTVVSDRNRDGRHRPSPHANDPKTRYRPMQFHARGGLGAVYRAEDKELRRMVALKEILPEHSDNPKYQEKFVFEAEVTGALEHPGIVPVYGLGRYSDDQPYYAMRFIRGKSLRKAIEDFHQQHPEPSAATYFTRDFRSLLRRLIETCNALHYAHQHGVVHRDIKPDNIMLGNYGETLVVDWGLARMMSDKARQERVPVTSMPIALSGSGSQTRYGSAVGTPMYMSPEQAAGKHDELDGRTDVYSLGGVLFNIVTGSHPVEGKSALDVVNNVRTGKLKQMHAVAPAAPRALASICSKAMALDPQQRYESATALADDIDRWIGDEVVQAHIGHEGALEKAGRLIRRYRSWTLSGAAALLLITATAIIAAIMIQQAKHKEEIAKQQATEFKSEAVARYRDSRDAIDTWLIQSSDALQYFPGTQPVRQQLLQLAIEDYERLASVGSKDPELELERARAHLRLGDLAQMQNDFPQSRSHYQQALAVLDQAATDPQLDRQFQAERGNVMNRMGLSWGAEEQTDQAEKAFRDAIDLLANLNPEASEPKLIRYLASTHANQGELLTRLARLEAAEASLQEAVRQYSRLQNRDDDRAALGLARSSELLGRLHGGQGDHDTARRFFQQAIDDLSPRVDAQPDHPEFLDALASAYVSQASSYRAQGWETEQFANLESAVGNYRALCKALPDVPGYEENLAITLVDLGLTLHEAGDNPAAHAHLTEAQDILTRLASFYRQVPRFREELAGCWDALGQVELETNPDPSKAIELLAGAVTTYQALFQEFPDQADYVERLAVAQSHYAQALWRQGDADSARQGFQAAISAFEQLIALVDDLPKYSSYLGYIHEHYGTMLHELNDEAALQQFEQSRDRWRRIGQKRTARDAHRLAWLLATCPIETVRDLETAAVHSEEALTLTPGNPTYRNTAALIELLRDEPDKAGEQLDQASKRRGQPIDRDYFVEAMLLRSKGDDEAAEGSLQKGIEWMETHRPLSSELKRLRSLADPDP